MGASKQLYEQLTEADIHFANTVMTPNRRAGRIVTTSTGKQGVVYNVSEMINQKVQVHCSDGSKLLCDPNTLTYNGFID